MNQTSHLTDLALKDAVSEELRCPPRINSAGIGVSVANGTVTLSGVVDSYPQKLMANRGAQRVRGVSALAQEITVANTWRGIDDSDVAAEAGEALKRNIEVPESVKATVQNHAVTLAGTVEWQHEREAAGRAVQFLDGVGSLHNLVMVRPRAHARDIKASINAALERSAQLAGRTIGVTTDSTGGVVLRGTVGSWAEHRQAEHVSWAAPGITSVDNQRVSLDGTLLTEHQQADMESLVIAQIAAEEGHAEAVSAHLRVVACRSSSAPVRSACCGPSGSDAGNSAG